MCFRARCGLRPPLPDCKANQRDSRMSGVARETLQGIEITTDNTFILKVHGMGDLSSVNKIYGL